MKTNTNEYLMKEARKQIASLGGQANLKKYGKDYYKALSKKGVEAKKMKQTIMTAAIETARKKKIDFERLADFEEWKKTH